MIGADLRKPKLHKDFNIDETKGLSSYLINKSNLSEIIEKTEVELLDVIGSGPVPPNPAELLDSKRMEPLPLIGQRAKLTFRPEVRFRVRTNKAQTISGITDLFLLP